MKKVFLNLSGGYDKGYITELSSSETENMYLIKNKEVSDVDVKYSLGKRQGLKKVIDLTFQVSGGIRLLFVYKDIVHLIIGNKILQMDKGLNTSYMGQINTLSSSIQVVANEYQMLIVDGVNGYYYEPTTNLYKVIPNLVSPIGCANFSGYFLSGRKGTNKIYYSEINDCSKWNVLDFFKITSYPDEVMNLLAIHGLLYVFGKNCIEIWYPTGNANVPFSRNLNEVVDYGCGATSSLTSEGGIFAFLATSREGKRFIVANSSGSFSKISNNSLDAELETYETIEDASSFMYSIDGNFFYQINFTEENKSWLYNFDSSTWSLVTHGVKDRHRANRQCYFDKKHYVGDYAVPIIYSLGDSWMDDDGIPFRKRRVSPVYILNNYDYFTLWNLTFILSRGYGTSSGTSKEPKLKLRISRDGGRTYGGELSRNLSRLGHRINWEVKFQNFGRMKSIVFELKCDDNIDFFIEGVFAEYEVL